MAVIRIAALLAVLVATALVAVSLFVPWWGFARESSGIKRWERYGPYHRDARATGDEYRQETTTLGGLALGALGALVFTAVAYLLAMARRPTRSGWGLIFNVLALLLLAAVVLYPVIAFPTEANRDRHSHLSFIDRECLSSQSASLCYSTAAGAGWYLVLVAAVFTFGAFLAQRAGRPDLDAEAPARPAAPAAAPVAVLKPRADAPSTPVAASAPTRSTKCPQCQTRVTYRKAAGGPAMAECHNCGLRFPA